METLLQVKGLKTYFSTEEGVVPAVDGVDFSLGKGETLAIVGESGCGKSVTALSVLRIVPSPPGRILSGEILYQGEDLLKKSEKEMRKVRGEDISMIFQEPLTSLNPVFTIGYQICDILRIHRKMTKKEARKHAIDMLAQVRIPSPEKVFDDYPHQLSGGMRQRVMIAMALACNPSILIADEPTTALDVTIQAQIMHLLRDLQQVHGSSVILITHDMGVVAQIAQRVMVMYAGQAVEYGDVKSIFKNPAHPYTIGLLKSIPSINESGRKLYSITGSIPSPADYPKGCRFSSRCEQACGRCAREMPPLFDLGEGRQVRCWAFEKGVSHE